MIDFKISSSKFQKLIIAIPIGLIIMTSGLAQRMTEAEAITVALQNNPMIRSAEIQVDHFRQLKKTGSDMGKLTAVYMQGQFNTIEQDNNISLSQSIPFPGTIGAQLKLGEQHVVGSTKNLMVAKNNLTYEVRSVYEALTYQKAIQNLLISQDSLYTEFARASSLRYKTGESNLLEMTTAETQLQEIRNQVRQNESDIFMSQKKLQTLLKSEVLIDASATLGKRVLEVDPAAASLDANPLLQYQQQLVNISEQAKRVEKNRLLPDFVVGYFNQTLIGYQNTTGQEKYYGKSNRFQGFTAGIAIPLWFGPQAARAKAATLMEESTRHTVEYYRTTLNSDYEQSLRELDKNQASLIYYESSALKNADLILTQGRKAYKGGEIGYVEYLQSLKSAITIKTNYLNALNQYNLSVIKVEYLIGKF